MAESTGSVYNLGSFQDLEMAESMGSVYNLGYFQDLKDYDKNRFFQVHFQDSLTTVAISKVQLTGMKEDKTVTEDFDVLTRSSKEAGHAEKQTVVKIRRQIKQLEDSGAKLETLTLVMNITYSPCNDADNNCQKVLQQFLETLGCKITFFLRFAYLYHEEGLRGDDKPIIEQLANWMIALEAVCKMTVEPIEVTKELSSYSPRVEKGAKKKREKKDEAMKDTVRQVYIRKREIEEANRQRAEAAAASLGKMKI